jgi:deazaflavin-dependent oxidoreductase (nitroreductase family)
VGGERIGAAHAVAMAADRSPLHLILANPEVEVQVGTAKMKARARTATGEERVRLWEKALEFWPPYADYQKKTEREIPVVVLDPVR